LVDGAIAYLWGSAAAALRTTHQGAQFADVEGISSRAEFVEAEPAKAATRSTGGSNSLLP
jgi:hypothetical protein